MQKILSGQKRVLWDGSDENETNTKIWFELHNEFPKNQCVVALYWTDFYNKTHDTNEGKKDNGSVHLIKGVTCIYHGIKYPL